MRLQWQVLASLTLKSQLIGKVYMQKHFKVKLDKLAERLEIKSSQQNAWENYVKSITLLADKNINVSHKDADAAALSRFRAERVAEFAKKLSVIADATEQLQAVLTADQRKVLNEATRHYLHGGHGWRKTNHGLRGVEHAHNHQGKSESDAQQHSEPVAETQ